VNLHFIAFLGDIHLPLLYVLLLTGEQTVGFGLVLGLVLALVLGFGLGFGLGFDLGFGLGLVLDFFVQQLYPLEQPLLPFTNIFPCL